MVLSTYFQMLQAVVIEDTVIYPFTGSAFLVNLLILPGIPWYAWLETQVTMVLYVDSASIAARGTFSFEEVFAGLGDSSRVCMDILQKEYGLSEEEAMALFRHVWIYTYGIASLCATGMCRFSDEEINDLLGQDFMAMLSRVKNGGLNQQTPHPMPKP